MPTILRSTVAIARRPLLFLIPLLLLPATTALAGDQGVLVRVAVDEAGGGAAADRVLVAGWAQAFAETGALSLREVEQGSLDDLLDRLAAGKLDVVVARQPLGDDLALRTGPHTQIDSVVIGRKGESFIVHPDNPVEELTLPQLVSILTGKTTSWSRVGGREQPIKIVMKGSGATQAHLQQTFLRGRRWAPRRRLVGDKQKVVDLVARDRRCIGFASLTQALEAQDRVRVLRLADSGVEALDTYAVTRPLLLYARTPRSPGVERLVTFALSSEGQALLWEADYAPVSIPEHR